MKECWIATKLWTSPNPISSITIDCNGNFYYTSWNDVSIIFKVDNLNYETKKLTEIEDTHLTSIVCDKSNNLYVLDLLEQVLLCYCCTFGTIEIIAKFRERNENSMQELESIDDYYVNKLCVDDAGNIYVSDNSQIRKINPQTRTLEVVVGSWKQGYEDGLAWYAQLNQPHAMSIQGATIYFVERGNDKIRQVHNGMVSTIESTHKYFMDPLNMCLRRDGIMIVGERYQSYARILDVKHKAWNNFNIVLPNIHNFSHMLLDSKDNLYVVSIDVLLKIEDTWNRERILWIGHLKEEATYCPLARIPRDVVGEIAHYCGRGLKVVIDL